MQKTKFYSWKNRKIAKGCRMCVKGKKLVLFVTGICSTNCWYCPLSEQKKNKDVVFANEWRISKDEDIIREAELCSAEGAGITGGDPLLKLERTIKYIKMLKSHFGKKFHIHLYIPLDHVTKEKMQMLYDAGLDEIRMHPNIIDNRLWERVETVASFEWDVGVEIPVIPTLGNETEKLIGYFSPYIKFLNLNELEQSDMNMDDMVQRGFKTKSMLDYSIEGSEKLAFRLMRKFPKLDIHYCTTKLKDAVQLAERIKIRAKNSAEEFDKITEEGMLVRGAIYLEELKPSFGYRDMLSEMTESRRKEVIGKLEQSKKEIQQKYCVSDKMIKVDRMKLRLLTSNEIAKKIKEPKLACAVVTEYPTWDQTEIELDFF